MMNEIDFYWLLMWTFGILAGIGIILMIVEEVSLKYFIDPILISLTKVTAISN